MPSVDDNILQIVDGYYSHTKHLDMVDKAREHGVAIVSLPSHFKHKLQPIVTENLFIRRIVGRWTILEKFHKDLF